MLESCAADQMFRAEGFEARQGGTNRLEPLKPHTIISSKKRLSALTSLYSVREALPPGSR